ncbi:malonate decarboxylase acyl carrier protein [Janthinobacterium fluminis]|uniref:Malonate decarboxylase acyl carrier protein n=1 Tax=Janthinobacterium fluminis TaxID=2987524 RepID=A0ABT5JUA4_9BURK|nr:malonate decarboxylase acyl carrier protein [Janthinobacterium fluminis]MDC8756338.1 malonate decarboxylase acyl carrier protein [Janthinobacterium fluminis]
METLTYHFEHGSCTLPLRAQLVGVAGSGNLEVLIEPAQLDGGCCVEVRTAAAGFGATWAAVIRDFNERWRLADVRVAINDVGATPAVVSLRLDQAVETMMGETR